MKRSLGLLFYLFENFIKALNQDSQNSNLQERLGIMYEFGYGTNIDLVQSFNFYQKAAKQGKTYSQYRLAEFYQLGKVVSMDLDMAESYYKLACKNGIKPACEKL